jgi:lactose/L-arabinose transport system permease protein
LFILPFFVLFGVFGAFPMVFSGVVSLFRWRGLSAGEFVGLTNYIDLMKDPSFLRSVINTAVIWLGNVPPMLFLALVLATVLNSVMIRFKGIFRTIFYLPIITSLVVAGLVFSLILDPDYGLVNNLLVAVGLNPVNWLADPTWSKPAVIITVLWRWTGYNMAIMLAGLQSIDPELYEAAQVDGASGIQQFWRITVPLMKPIIVFTMILSTIGTINLFDEVFMLFRQSGGVGESALTPGLLLYRSGFEFLNFGYASAIAYAIAIITFVLSLIQLRLIRSDTE